MPTERGCRAHPLSGQLARAVLTCSLLFSSSNSHVPQIAVADHFLPTRRTIGCAVRRWCQVPNNPSCQSFDDLGHRDMSVHGLTYERFAENPRKWLWEPCDKVGAVELPDLHERF